MLAMFKYVTRHKVRFLSSRGELSIEQLWDVPLRSKDEFNLNTLAQVANTALKKFTEDNFVDANSKTEENTKAEYRLEAIKYIIEVKLREEDELKKRAERKLEREKIMKALEEKQDGKLSAMSEAQLKKRLTELNE